MDGLVWRTRLDYLVTNAIWRTDGNILHRQVMSEICRIRCRRDLLLHRQYPENGLVAIADFCWRHIFFPSSPFCARSKWEKKDSNEISKLENKTV